MLQAMIDDLQERFPSLDIRDINQIDLSFRDHGKEHTAMLSTFKAGLDAVYAEHYLELQKNDELYFVTIINKEETWEINIAIDRESLSWTSISHSPIEPPPPFEN